MNPLILAALQAILGGILTPGTLGAPAPGGVGPPSPGTPAGGANPGLLTSIGAMLNPADPMAGLLQLVSGFSLLPYAQKQEGSLENVQSFLTNPAKFSNLINKLTVPMNKRLVKTLQQEGEAAAAESGLGQSGGAVASAVAKAAAPYVQGNIQAGPQTAFDLLRDQLAVGQQLGNPYARFAAGFTNPDLGGSLY